MEVTILWKRATPADPKRKKTTKITPVYIYEDNAADHKADDKGSSQAFLAAEADTTTALADASTTDGTSQSKKISNDQEPPSSRTSSPASSRDNSPANSPASTPASTPSKSPPLSPVNANPPQSPMEQRQSSSRYDAAGNEIDHSSYPDSLAFPGGINIRLRSHNRFMAKVYKTRKIINTSHSALFQLTKQGTEPQYVNLDLEHTRDPIATLYKNKDSKYHCKTQWNGLHE